MKIIYGIFLVCVALIVLILLATYFPFPFGIKSFVVLTGSMEPAIQTGSVVVVMPAKAYKSGDVVTFSEADRVMPVTHRIIDATVERGQVSYITKGDANEDEDIRRVAPGQIIGRVQFSLPYIGYAVESAKKPYGFLAIVIIPAGLVIYGEIKRIRTEVRRIREKKKGDVG